MNLPEVETVVPPTAHIVAATPVSIPCVFRARVQLRVAQACARETLGRKSCALVLVN